MHSHTGERDLNTTQDGDGTDLVLTGHLHEDQSHITLQSHVQSGVTVPSRVLQESLHMTSLLFSGLHFGENARNKSLFGNKM